MNYKGNTVSLKMFSEITDESCVYVHHPKVYDQHSNIKDYYVIQDIKELVNSGREKEDVIEEIEAKYLLEPIKIEYNKSRFSDDNFTLSLALNYKGSNDVLRIKLEKETEIDKLLTVDIDNQKIIKKLKYKRIPNEVSDLLETFIIEFKSYVNKANNKAKEINNVRKQLIRQYTKERIDFNNQEQKMRQLLNK